MGINSQAPTRRAYIHIAAPLMIILTASIATMITLHPASAYPAHRPVPETLMHR
jgi:hypothetical protein